MGSGQPVVFAKHASHGTQAFESPALRHRSLTTYNLGVRQIGRLRQSVELVPVSRITRRLPGRPPKFQASGGMDYAARSKRVVLVRSEEHTSELQSRLHL